MEMVMTRRAREEYGAFRANTRRTQKKILWVSQHTPEPGQWIALRRMFGNKFKRDVLHPFQDAGQIVRKFIEGEYDDMVVVAPLSVKMEIVEAGFEPIQAVKKDGEYVLERFHGADIRSTPI